MTQVLTSYASHVLVVLFSVAGLTAVGSDAPRCQNITVALDTSGMVSITPADVDGGSTDNSIEIIRKYEKNA